MTSTATGNKASAVRARNPAERIRPKLSAHLGRVHVVQVGTAHPTQALLLTDAEAAGWLAATAAEEN
jgi:hypothetical protein